MNQNLQFFLESNGISNNRFYGCLIDSGKGFYLFEDVISKQEGNLLIDIKGNRINVWFGFEIGDYEPEHFYEFSIFYNDVKKLPNVDFKYNPPSPLKFNPYERIVSERFETLDRPEQNKIIANLLREIGMGMYSSKQRMIFELLQNADDSPAGEEIKFHIDFFNGNLLIMHNGLPFNKDDVLAITSAAQSTKKRDKKKTGYKGIGFKSVFTDSQKVLIKSGGFLFVFDRENPSYKDFDNFYLNREDFQLNKRLRDKYSLRWEKDRKEFNGYLDIPWQLLPVWINETPQYLKDSRLFKYNNNVGIAIRLGQNLSERYLEAIDIIAENPAFMLFLRHVTLFKSFKNSLTILKEGTNPVRIKKIKENKINYDQSYYKYEWKEIPVNNDEFEKEGISIFKHEVINDFGERSYFFARDEKGVNKIENVAPKISSSEVTSITFAAPIYDGTLMSESGYLNDLNINCFYTFLPLSEKRIQLPILINADFVLSSNREGIQGDNEWNEFLFSRIGSLYLDWLVHIAELGLSQDTVHPEYLSMLLKGPLILNKEVQPLIEVFNRKYLGSLDVKKFILDNENELRVCNEIILDNTDISIVLNSSLFYEITESTQYLPHFAINSQYLKYDYLKISQFDFSDLVEILFDSDKVELIRAEFTRLEEFQKVNFLNWVNRNFEKLQSVIQEIFFIQFDDKLLSVKEALSLNNYFVYYAGFEGLKDILATTEAKFSAINFDDFPNILKYLKKEDNYFSNDQLLYTKIFSINELGDLTPEIKNKLLTFLNALEGIADRTIEKIEIFKTQSGNHFKSLNNLISSSHEGLPLWLQDFIILKEEENVLDNQFKGLLIQQRDIFEKILTNEEVLTKIQGNLKPKEVNEFYSFVNELYLNLEEDHRIKYKDLPWIYSESIGKFHLSDHFYTPPCLDKVSKSKYLNYQEIVNSKTELEIPSVEANDFRKKMQLPACDGNVLDSIILTSGFAENELVTFLDFLKLNLEGDFFKRFTINLFELDLYKIKEGLDVRHFYSENQKLIALIKEHKFDLELLPNPLYSTGLEKIGLLTNADLLIHLIEVGVTDINLAPFVYEFKTDAELCVKYLTSLTELKLQRSMGYDKKSPEYKTLELIAYLSDSQIDDFRERVKIDEAPLNNEAVSADLWFKCNGKREKVELQLPEVLPQYKEKAYSKTAFIDTFAARKVEGQKEKLERLFDTCIKDSEEIRNELLEDTNQVLTGNQLLFLHFYFQEKGYDKNLLEDYLSFRDLIDSDNEVYESEAKVYLNQCFKEKLVNNPFEFFSFPDFVPEEKIWDKEYALECEAVPLWIRNWVRESEGRLTYLVKAGLNSTESHVVNFRKAYKDQDLSKQNTNGGDIPKQLLKQSLHWIKDNNLLQNVDSLKEIYIELENSQFKVEDLLIPIVNENGLELVEYLTSVEYHFKSSNWGSYTNEIKKVIWRNGNFVIDDTLSPEFRQQLSPIEEGIDSKINLETIAENSEPFSDNYYLNWEGKSELEILLYGEEKFPWDIYYQEFLVGKEFDSELFKVTDIGQVIVLKEFSDSIPKVIKSALSDDIYNTLSALKAKVKVESENGNLDNRDEDQGQDLNKAHYKFSPREEQALLDLFENQPDESFYKNWNLATLIKALVDLPEIYQYNVDEAMANLKISHEFAQLEPVYINEDFETPYTVMGRSAANGLLYMTVQAWQRLERTNVLLFVNFGNNNHKLFYSQQEVLDFARKDCDYQIMRISSEPTTKNINDILSGEFDKKKLWLVLKMKDNEKSDYLFKSWEPNDSGWED